MHAPPDSTVPAPALTSHHHQASGGASLPACFRPKRIRPTERCMGPPNSSNSTRHWQLAPLGPVCLVNRWHNPPDGSRKAACDVKWARTTGGVCSSCWGADKPLPVVNTVQFIMFRSIWNGGKAKEKWRNWIHRKGLENSCLEWRNESLRSRGKESSPSQNGGNKTSGVSSWFRECPRQGQAGATISWLDTARAPDGRAKEKKIKTLQLLTHHRRSFFYALSYMRSSVWPEFSISFIQTDAWCHQWISSRHKLN
jgi:hypothetical protein